MFIWQNLKTAACRLNILNDQPSDLTMEYPPNANYGLLESSRPEIQNLYALLSELEPMNKRGPMSGRCMRETDQMVKFLTENFGFENIDGRYIVQGVRAFQLSKPPTPDAQEKVIYFPSASEKPFFSMTVDEILRWQQSYVIYADKSIEGLNKEFLMNALQGGSQDGEEAFRMKFVVRISTCPILMEFDGRVIERQPEDDWPNRIKLVSVTGIDFAGRKHDVDDIRKHITNWKDVFEIDSERGIPIPYFGRDFILRRNCPKVQLDENLVFENLKRMSRLRLRACDTEGVQVVVETGIGLGVFAGKHLGIDERIRKLSAKAIREVLEEDGESYKKILGVVFALPFFGQDPLGKMIRDTLHDFTDEFRQSNYKGPIPVMIADQDMHRLTVTIAKQGFIVSELNPADSHGVFGEYWQNNGPAVEEKLALTTLGLLVQHHLINKEVLNPEKYYLIDPSEKTK